MVANTQAETEATLANYDEDDYIEAGDVSYHGRNDGRIDAIVRDADTHGNVIKAIMMGDDGTVGCGSRRDDCHNEDGTLPNWNLKLLGELSVADAPEPWAGAGVGDIIEWTFNSVDIEDFTIRSKSRELEVDVYDPYEHGHMTVTFNVTN